MSTLYVLSSSRLGGSSVQFSSVLIDATHGKTDETAQPSGCPRQRVRVTRRRPQQTEHTAPGPEHTTLCACGGRPRPIDMRSRSQPVSECIKSSRPTGAAQRCGGPRGRMRPCPAKYGAPASACARRVRMPPPTRCTVSAAATWSDRSCRNRACRASSQRRRATA